LEPFVGNVRRKTFYAEVEHVKNGWVKRFEGGPGTTSGHKKSLSWGQAAKQERVRVALALNSKEKKSSEFCQQEVKGC